MAKQIAKQHPLMEIIDQLGSDPNTAANKDYLRLREEALRALEQLNDARQRETTLRIGMLLRQAVELGRLVLQHFGDSS